MMDIRCPSFTHFYSTISAIYCTNRGVEIRVKRVSVCYTHGNMEEPTNTEILKAITALSKTVEELAGATAKGFTAVEKRLDAVEERLDAVDRRLKGLESKVEVLEAQHKDTRVLIELIPDEIEATYGRMLNAHEDRLRTLEAA